MFLGMEKNRYLIKKIVLPIDSGKRSRYLESAKGGKSAFDHGAPQELYRADPSDPRNTAVSVGNKKCPRGHFLFLNHCQRMWCIKNWQKVMSWKHGGDLLSASVYN